jgi:SAM-dependent methyltransferase
MLYREPKFETHFNVPIIFDNDTLIAVNERIVEYPFIFCEVCSSSAPQKILDFGCTRSWLSLSLSSLGHEVIGVDLRPYPFIHRNFNFINKNILELYDGAYDFVISLSTLEHVGLGAYGESYDKEALFAVIRKIHAMLKPNGKFILTLPVGISSVDQFEKSFSPSEIINIVQNENFAIGKEKYFKRESGKYWFPATKNSISKVPNDVESREIFVSGVNGVGCFTFLKT